MRTLIHEQWKVSDLLKRIPGSKVTLKENKIDNTRNMNFKNAASAVSASTEQTLAVMENRMRRAARKQQEVAAKKSTEADLTGMNL